MANELKLWFSSGQTLYALVVRETDGNIWNGSTFESPVTANWTTYDIALTEQSTTGLYYGSMPSVSAGIYNIYVLKQLGGTPAATDVLVGQGALHWSGSANIPLSEIPTNVWDKDHTSYGAGSNFGTLLVNKAEQSKLITVEGKVDTVDAIVDSILLGVAGISSRIPTSLVGGRIDANIGAISTDATAADNLERAYDGTGYNVGGGSIVVASVTGSIGSLATQAKADVNAEVDTALSDYDPPTNAEMVARTLAAASYATASNQTTIINYIDTEIAAIKDVTDKLDTTLELDGAEYRFTENALELGPTTNSGDGSILVNHDYGGTDNLRYEESSGGIGIDNAIVRAYLKSDYDAGNIGADYIVASTRTNVNGRWENNLMLDPETYIIYFYKQGEFGPDTVEIEVT